MRPGDELATAPGPHARSTRQAARDEWLPSRFARVMLSQADHLESPVRRSLGGLGLVAVLFSALSTPAKPGARPRGAAALPVLTRIEQVRNLTAGEAQRGYPVRVRAVVTYFGLIPGELPDLFIQDASAGIWVDLGKDTKASLRSGQLVEIEGISSAPDFAPEIAQPQIKVLGEGRLPVAKPVSFERMASGAEDSQWVEVEGIVHSAVQEKERLTLSLAVDRGRVVVRVLSFGASVRQGLVDAKLRLRGACGSLFNQKNQQTGVILYVPSLAQLKIEEPASGDPFTLPLQATQRLLAFTPKGASGHRVRVEGTVTFEAPDEPLFIQDGDQGLRVDTVQRTGARPGDRVSVAGFLSPGGNTPVLEDAVVRRLGPGAEPAAIQATSEQLMTGAYDADLVRIDARLRDQVRRRGASDLVLESGEVIFDAEIAEGASAAPPRLTSGSRLELTGVCSLGAGQGRAPRAFRLLLRSARDIVVVARPPWWTAERAAWALGAMGLVILAATGWVLILRRRVAEQTGVILRRLQCEIALEDRYRDLFENATDIVYTHRLDGRITSLNRAGERATGYSREEAVNMDVNDLAAPEYRGTIDGMMQRKLLTGEATTYEIEIVGKDGRRVPLEISTRLIHREGKPFEVQGNARDITERKRIEAEMKWARDAAEAASRSKSEFLANVSHEIRTPMNGILGMTALALETRLEPEQREYLEIVKSSADSLLKVLNDILDFAKIEAHKLECEAIAFRLREALAGALKAPARWARDKGLNFECRVSGQVPEVLIGDPARLGQIVLNLAANAVKFTERGRVQVQVEVQSMAKDQAFLRFSVSDTGIGIPAEKQQIIFEAFAQADGSTTRKYGGSGLGLAISTQLVELMGGRIWVESEPGRGSTFYFTARFGRDPNASPESLEKPKARADRASAGACPDAEPENDSGELPPSGAEGSPRRVSMWKDRGLDSKGAAGSLPPPAGLEEEAVFDRAAALERLEGDSALLAELAALFVEDCPQLMASIRQAIECQDPEALARAAHALKGSVSNFAARRAVDQALRLEAMGRQGDLEGAPEAYGALQATLGRLIEALTGLAKGVAR